MYITEAVGPAALKICNYLVIRLVYWTSIVQKLLLKNLKLPLRNPQRGISSILAFRIQKLYFKTCPLQVSPVRCKDCRNQVGLEKSGKSQGI